MQQKLKRGGGGLGAEDNNTRQETCQAPISQGNVKHELVYVDV